MLGAIVGDVVGSRFEFDNERRVAYSRKYELVTVFSTFTDDSVMTLAIADALMKVAKVKGDKFSESEFESQVIKSMQKFGKLYPNAGYGMKFYSWLKMKDPKPYGSWGNGSAMRVSPVAWAFDNLEDVERFAEISARVSHNHPEGIKGAKSIAGAIFLARTGKSKDEIKSYVCEKYNYDLSRTLDEIRPYYTHDESCQRTVPEAVTAFLESKDFEDAIRCAVSLSGDADTLTDITCSIAEGFWGVPEDIENIMVRPLLDDYLISELDKWNEFCTIAKTLKK